MSSTTDKPVREQRYGPRWATHRELQWRIGRRGRVRRGTVLERSLYGLVLAAEEMPAPLSVGEVIRPVDRGQSRAHGFRVGVVRRVEPRSDGPAEFVAVVELLA